MSRLVQAIVVVGMILPLLAIPSVSSPAPTEARVWAALLWALCLVPSLVYVFQSQESRRPIPFIQLIGLEFGLYYGLQGVFWGAETAGRRAFVHPFAHLPPAIKLVSLGVLSLMLSYWAVISLSGSGRRRKEEAKWLPSVASMRQWGLLLLLGGTLAEILLQLGVPGALRRPLLFGYRLSFAGAGFLIYLWFRGYLERKHQVVLGVCGAILLLFQFTSGTAAAFLMFCVGMIIPVWIAKRRIGFRLLMAGIAIILFTIVLRGVIPEYRNMVWGSRAGVFERTEILYGLLEERVERAGLIGVMDKGSEAVVGRSTVLATFADVMRQTPERVPYWNGDTYHSLIFKPIPRAVWPSKPRVLTGQAFGHRYGYLDPNDHRTSWNMPYVIEMYANFGYIWVIFGMAIVGAIFSMLSIYLNSRSSPASKSLFVTVIFVPLLNVEVSATLLFGGLILDGMALWIVVKIASKYPYPLGK